MKNQVIKVLNAEHGKQVIQYWRDRGLDTEDYAGTISEENNRTCIYYGVINDKFSNYSLRQVKEYNVEVIELPSVDYVQCTYSETSHLTVGKIYNFPNPIDDTGDRRNIGILDGGLWKFKPSTKKAFNNQNLKIKNMRTITYEQAQQIVDIACGPWKLQLFDKWGKYIVLKQSIDISDEFYKSMRDACTGLQNKVFDEIFGTENNFKVGDWVYIIDGKPGSTGANDNIGQITNEKSSNGLLHSDEGMNILIGRNVWRVNLDAKLRHATEEEIQSVQYKVGDWVIGWFTNHVDYKKVAWEIGKISGEFIYPKKNLEHNADRRHLRLATEQEIQRAQYKVGDWVIDNEGRYPARQVTAITAYAITYEDGTYSFDYCRLATEEEITKANSIPEGTPCLVRDNEGDAWKLAYSDGNGRFEWKYDCNSSWNIVQKLDVNNLPKYNKR